MGIKWEECFMTKYLCRVILVMACALSATAVFDARPVAAQSGSRTRGVQSEPFEVQFWKWLSQVQYRRWAVPAGRDRDRLYPGESPHGALLRIYLNETAAANPKQLPPGSIVVKENYNKERQLMAITVMYRTKGFDPEHNDWWYGKYMPNGQIAAMKMEGTNQMMKLAGKVQGCIKCHENAGGDDYAFFND